MRQAKNSILQLISDPQTRNIFYFLILNLSFTFVEAIYGIITNSLSLTTDALHMLFDSTAIILGLAASLYAKKKPTKSFPYGFSRVETLVGFINGLALVVAALRICFEAVERIYSPVVVKRDGLMMVGVLGFIVNLIGMFAFGHGSSESHSTCSHTHSHSHSHSHSHNHTHSHGNSLMHGMFLHVVADTLGSIGVIISTLLMDLYGWQIADPICSLVIAILILLSTYPLLKNSGAILMQRVPYGLESKINLLEAKILEMKGIESVDAFRVWEMSSGKYVGSMRVMIGSVHNLRSQPSKNELDSDAILKEILKLCEHDLGVVDMVVQVSRADTLI